MSYIPLRTVRVAVPALAAGLTSGALSAVWPQPFADTLYCIAPGVFDPAGLINEVTITAYTKTGCTFTVKNIGLSAITAGTAFVHLTATHD